MTEEQKEQLNKIVKELGGQLSYWVCSEKHTEYNKIVIEYDSHRKA